MSTLRDSVSTLGERARLATQRGHGALANLQEETGCVNGEVVWCAMLAAQWVFVSHLTGKAIPLARRRRLLRHFDEWQNPDGGFGLHWDSHSYLYVTTLVYLAVRFLGVAPDEGIAAKARAWLDGHSMTAIPTWGKLWLSILNLYDYEGVHPIQPEMWLLPEWAPVHPRRYYCHTRLIYMGFGALYGRRFQAPHSPLVDQLREELYGVGGWDRIDWPKHRWSISSTDLYVEPDWVLDTMYKASDALETVIPGFLRKRALRDVMDRIVFEQRSSNFAGISPVNGMLNTLALFQAEHPDFEASYQGIEYWMWEDDTLGLRVAGATSHTWDTAFATQALCEGPSKAEAGETLAKMYAYFDGAQIQQELPEGFERYHRLPSRGGWCFGDPTHHWPVSDCTAEALLAICAIHDDQPVARRISDQRLVEAVQFLQRRHNPDGGFGSYESQRGNALLEHINPSEMFGNCMSEYSYIECTSSCIQAMTRVQARFPGLLPSAISDEAARQIQRGATFLATRQQDDGAWPGFWGINYTYGTMYGVTGLLAAGRAPSDPAITRACEWLLANRLADGGWGEDYRSHLVHRYQAAERSQVIQTSWAMLTLMRAEYRTPESQRALEEAAAILVARQLPDGTWPIEKGAGLFFDTVVHYYDLYRTYFPQWALGRFVQAGWAGR